MNKNFFQKSNATDEPSAEDLQWLSERLANAPQVPASANLTHRVMSAVHHQQLRDSRMRLVYNAAAAMVIIGLSAWGILSVPARKAPAVATQASATPSATTANGVGDAVEWFCRSQEQDGSWDPARWGGDSRFKVALTALPLLALSTGEGEKTPRQQAALVKAMGYLLSNCDERGRFGSSFYGSSYTQGVATLALLSCYQIQPEAELKPVLQRALDVIICQEQPYGSWTIADATPSRGIAILWQREALKKAAAMGWDVPTHIHQTADWLVGDALANTDVFSLYIASIHLRERGNSSAMEELSSIRKALLEKQVLQGENSGSWAPDCRWSAVGGRLYSTAMASLALR